MTGKYVTVDYRVDPDTHYNYGRPDGRAGAEHLWDNVQHPIHPDGQPWPKSCGIDLLLEPPCRCAVTDGRIKLDSDARQYPFICTHRLTDDGHTRVCAGWDKLFGKNWKE